MDSHSKLPSATNLKIENLPPKVFIYLFLTVTICFGQGSILLFMPYNLNFSFLLSETMWRALEPGHVLLKKYEYKTSSDVQCSASSTFPVLFFLLWQNTMAKATDQRKHLNFIQCVRGSECMMVEQRHEGWELTSRSTSRRQQVLWNLAACSHWHIAPGRPQVLRTITN